MVTKSLFTSEPLPLRIVASLIVADIAIFYRPGKFLKLCTKHRLRTSNTGRDFVLYLTTYYKWR